MKHLIIGGSGFTGRHLAEELLRRGERVSVVDIAHPRFATANSVEFQHIDIRSKTSLHGLSLQSDDIVHHLAATQYHGAVPRFGRNRYFAELNITGTSNLLQTMEDRGCSNLVYFSTDMVYGIPRFLPVTTDHPQCPLGPYGESKRQSEILCRQYRDKGFRITIFRPRLIVGAGRLGILEKLFQLIHRGWPVPLIGDGSNHYQMVSVHDCVAADLLAVDKGLPNQVYNLGSKDPPTVSELLEELIRRARSKSRVLRTPARLVKGLLALLDLSALTVLHKEQFAIADLNYLVDIEKTERELDWRPKHNDRDMLFEAFDRYLADSSRTSR